MQHAQSNELHDIKAAFAHVFSCSQQMNASVRKEHGKFYKADRLVIAYVIDGYSCAPHEWLIRQVESSMGIW